MILGGEPVPLPLLLTGLFPKKIMSKTTDGLIERFSSNYQMAEEEYNFS